MRLMVQMLAGVPEDKKPEARKCLQAVQDGLKKVQGAIDLKYMLSPYIMPSLLYLHAAKACL